MTIKRSDAANEVAQHKITQFLFEAHAVELALVQTLGAHIAITPAGEYRSGLETHLDETVDHALRIQKHLAKRDEKRSFLQVGYGLAQTVVGQAVAFGKLPVDLVRGTSPEEMLLKNARDECASEAAEIAMYLTIEQYAREVGDEETARLAKSIRADEERALERLTAQIPRLVADAVATDVDGKNQFALGRVGAVDGVRTAATSAARLISRGTGRAARVTEVTTQSSATSDRPSVSSPRASTSLKTPAKPAKSAASKRSTSRKQPAKAASRSTAKRPARSK